MVDFMKLFATIIFGILKFAGKAVFGAGRYIVAFVKETNGCERVETQVDENSIEYITRNCDYEMKARAENGDLRVLDLARNGSLTMVHDDYARAQAKRHRNYGV